MVDNALRSERRLPILGRKQRGMTEEEVGGELDEDDGGGSERDGSSSPSKSVCVALE